MFNYPSNMFPNSPIGFGGAMPANPPQLVSPAIPVKPWNSPTQQLPPHPAMVAPPVQVPQRPALPPQAMPNQPRPMLPPQARATLPTSAMPVMSQPNMSFRQPVSPIGRPSSMPLTQQSLGILGAGQPYRKLY